MPESSSTNTSSFLLVFLAFSHHCVLRLFYLGFWNEGILGNKEAIRARRFCDSLARRHDKRNSVGKRKLENF